jgi:hypothetical protein
MTGLANDVNGVTGAYTSFLNSFKDWVQDQNSSTSQALAASAASLAAALAALLNDNPTIKTASGFVGVTASLCCCPIEMSG